MAQFARPDADITDGNWLNEAASNVDLFESINEAIPADADFITSESAPSNSPCVVSLSDVEDPAVNTGHTVRYRYQKDATGGAQINLVVQLRETYVNEGAQGDLIASNTHNNIPNGWTDGSFVLTGPEADDIGNYNNLFFRFVANQV